jgi:hypothetical protein
MTEKTCNKIAEEQNSEKQLDRLAAQRYLYSEAKKVQRLQMVLMVLMPAIGAICVAVLQHASSVKSWVALYGITVSILDISFIDQLRKGKQELAAKIQELFDCDVLDLDWNDLRVGHKPDPESVHEAISHFKKMGGDYAKLQDWYPSIVGQVPMYFARLICQRATCRWDSQLRLRYCTYAKYILFTFAIIILSVSFIGGLTLQKFVLAVVAPVFPIFLFGIRDYKHQMETAEASLRQKEYVDSLWLDLKKHRCTQQEAETASRKLQDAIFDRRRGSQPVFDRVYEKLRNAHEEQMIKGAEQLVEDILHTLDAKNCKTIDGH